MMEASYSYISLKQIRAFIAVAEAGSFTIASEWIHMSQPALTHTIQQLEGFLKFTLFNRTSRRVVLTVEGEAFLTIAKSLEEGFITAMGEVSAMAKSNKGEISIAAVHSFAIGYLPKAVTEFLTSHPDVTVNLADDNSSGVMGRVRNREADFGITSINQDPELEFLQINSDVLGVAAKAGHPIFQAEKLTWNDLGGHEFYGFSQTSGLHALINAQGSVPEHIRNPRITAASFPVLEATLLLGGGFTIVPALAYPGGFRNGIQFQALEEPTIYRPIYLATRHDRPLGIAAQSLLDTLLALLPQMEVSGLEIESDD